MRGLVIREEPLRKILDGKKTWEIRGSATRIRGEIALIQSKSGTIVGTAHVVDCIGPLTVESMLSNVNRHRVDRAKLLAGALYPRTYAWVLSDVREFVTPLPYVHPPGAVRWVNLDGMKATISRRR